MTNSYNKYEDNKPMDRTKTIGIMLGLIMVGVFVFHQLIMAVQQVIYQFRGI